MSMFDDKFDVPEGILPLSKNIVYDVIEKKIFLKIENVHITMTAKEFISICQELEKVHKYIIDIASHDIIQKDPSGEEN